MIYVFDVDDTICTTPEADYANAAPKTKRIEEVNKLYSEGHTIYFLTARGMGRTDNDQMQAYQLYEMTEKQLKGWGIKFHRLFMGKPSGDIYVDDKGMRDSLFFLSS